MENLSTAGSRWELHSVLGYIKQVEISYAVSLKFWLDFRPAADSNTELFVFCWGSGTAFDLLPDRFAPRPSQIHPEEPNCIGEAIYYAVKHLETGFNSVREPLGARPSL